MVKTMGTMTQVRTPVSLNWLIKKRANIDGTRLHALNHKRQQIEDVERETRSLNARLSILKKTLGQHQQELAQLVREYDESLKALDYVIRQHEVKIDVSLIKAVKPHEFAPVLKYGEMTRAIFQCLRLSNGVSCSTTEVTLSVWDNAETVRSVGFDHFKERLRNRLSVLAHQGKIVNTNKSHNIDGQWVLAEQVNQKA
jgi:hypothetical protein